jgi:hypothetical protein
MPELYNVVSGEIVLHDEPNENLIIEENGKTYLNLDLVKQGSSSVDITDENNNNIYATEF